VKHFSIFKQALKLSESSRRQNLGDISSLSRWDFDERESFRFRAMGPSVEYACLMIENALLLQTNRAGRVYAGFQKLSCLQPIVDRYLRIADISESVYVFGEADWKPPRHPNIRVVALPPDFQLTREWFVIAMSPTLQVALIALDEGGLNTPLLYQRNFSAIKTSNPQTVKKLAGVAEGMVDWSVAA
jgi:DICT domain-containing protein